MTLLLIFTPYAFLNVRRAAVIGFKDPAKSVSRQGGYLLADMR